MLNLMKISWPASLTWQVCHLWHGEPDSMIVPSSSYFNFLDRFPTPFSDDDSEDENPPLPAHVPPIAPAPILPRWVRSICEAVGDLVGDPRDQRRTRSPWWRFHIVNLDRVLCLGNMINKKRDYLRVS